MLGLGGLLAAMGGDRQRRQDMDAKAREILGRLVRDEGELEGLIALSSERIVRSTFLGVHPPDFVLARLDELVDAQLSSRANDFDARSEIERITETVVQL